MQRHIDAGFGGASHRGDDNPTTLADQRERLRHMTSFGDIGGHDTDVGHLPAGQVIDELPGVVCRGG